MKNRNKADFAKFQVGHEKKHLKM